MKHWSEKALILVEVIARPLSPNDGLLHLCIKHHINSVLSSLFFFFFGGGGGTSLKIVPVKGKTDTNGKFSALWASVWSKNKGAPQAPPLDSPLSNTCTPLSVIKCDFIPYSIVREAKRISFWVPGTYPYSPSMGEVTIFNLFSSNIVLLFEEILWK